MSLIWFKLIVFDYVIWLWNFLTNCLLLIKCISQRLDQIIEREKIEVNQWIRHAYLKFTEFKTSIFSAHYLFSTCVFFFKFTTASTLHFDVFYVCSFFKFTTVSTLRFDVFYVRSSFESTTASISRFDVFNVWFLIFRFDVFHLWSFFKLTILTTFCVCVCSIYNF